MTKFIIVPLLYILLLSCGSQKEDKGFIKTGVLKGPSSVGFIKLIDSPPSIGNRTLKFRIYSNPITMRPELLKNRLDFAVIPASMAAMLYNKGSHYRIVAVTGWTNLFIVGKRRIDSIEDLKGETLHLVGKGITPSAIFKHLLKESGTEEKEIDLLWKFPNPADLGSAAAAGLVDFALLPEPFASMACNKNRELMISLDLSNIIGTPIPQTVLVVNRKLENSDVLLRKFLKLSKNSSKWVNRYPELAVPLVIKKGVIPSISPEAIRRCKIRFLPSAKAEMEIFNLFRILHSTDPQLTGGKIPDGQILLKKNL